MAIGLALPYIDDEDPVTNGEIQALSGVQRSRVVCFECFSCPSFDICDISMKFKMCRLRLSDNTTSLSPSVQILHCFQSLLAHFYRGIAYISKDYWVEYDISQWTALWGSNQKCAALSFFLFKRTNQTFRLENLKFLILITIDVKWQLSEISHMYYLN